MYIRLQPDLSNEQINKLYLSYQSERIVREAQLDHSPLSHDIKEAVKHIRPEILKQLKKKITG